MGRVLPTLQKRGARLASSGSQRALLAALPLARSFEDALDASALYPLRPTGIEILQINVARSATRPAATATWTRARTARR